MSTPLRAFKAARLFSPQKLHEMKPTDCSVVDSLAVLPFLDSLELSAMKTEFPNYIAAVEDISAEYSPLDFWKHHASSLPSWAKAVQKVLLVQPSSAAAERVFSLLKASFGEQQLHSLEDYIEASLMLQYNNR